MVLLLEAAMKGLVRLEQITVNDRLFLRQLNPLIGQSGWAFVKGKVMLKPTHCTLTDLSVSGNSTLGVGL